MASLYVTFSDLLPHVQQISIGAGLLVAVCCLVYRTKKKKQKIDEKQSGYLFVCLLSGYAIVQGIFLVCCCFSPELLTEMADYPAYVAIGAAFAVYLAVVTIIGAFDKD
ncbi:MAG: hypothetical protein ACLQVD_00025 [Capsulimonadaceae bacterium]